METTGLRGRDVEMLFRDRTPWTREVIFVVVLEEAGCSLFQLSA